jgi:hypothetical protein
MVTTLQLGTFDFFAGFLVVVEVDFVFFYFLVLGGLLEDEVFFSFEEIECQFALRFLVSVRGNGQDEEGQAKQK